MTFLTTYRLVILATYCLGMAFGGGTVNAAAQTKATQQASTEAYPFYRIVFDKDNKPVAATSISDEDIVSRIYSVQGYFSPTCGHCGDFFKTFLPELLAPVEASSNIKITFAFRPFQTHPYDAVIVALCLHEGEDKFAFWFHYFLTHQDEWLPHMVNADTLQAFWKALSPDDVQKMQSLGCTNEAQCVWRSYAPVLVQALKAGVKADSVHAVLGKFSTGDVAARLAATTLQAVVNPSAPATVQKPVDGVPAFYLKVPGSSEFIFKTGLEHQDVINIRSGNPLPSSGISPLPH